MKIALVGGVADGVGERARLMESDMMLVVVGYSRWKQAVQWVMEGGVEEGNCIEELHRKVISIASRRKEREQTYLHFQDRIIQVFHHWKSGM